MEETKENQISNKKKLDEILKNKLKDKYVLIIIAVLIFAFFVRLYFYMNTPGQPLWWDESEYMATAKHWAFGVPYSINPQRPPLFQYLSSLVFLSGFGENLIRILFVLIPSIFLVFLIYLLGKEMYGKKIGIIAAFLSSISWTFLFWTARVQPDFLSMCFQILSILFIWKYWKNTNAKLIIFSAFFAALGFYFKISALLIPVIIGLFIFMKERLSAFKNKDYYIFAAVFILCFIPYFLYGYFIFNNPLAIFQSGYVKTMTEPIPFGWYNLNFFYLLTENILFILFLGGLAISLKFLLYSDVLIKDKKRCFDPDIFGIIVLVVVSSFYIFYIRGTEDRWVFLWLPFIFFIISKFLLFIYDYVKKYNKFFALIVIILLILTAGYFQLNHANSIIENKKNSYVQIKEAGLWIKENSEKSDSVLSISYPQTVYYSERKTTPYSDFNESYLNEFVKRENTKYILISLIEPNHPEFIFQWAPNHPEKLIPRQAYTLSQSDQTPVAIIYEFNLSSFT